MTFGKVIEICRLVYNLSNKMKAICIVSSLYARTVMQCHQIRYEFAYNVLVYYDNPSFTHFSHTGVLRCSHVLRVGGAYSISTT